MIAVSAAGPSMAVVSVPRAGLGPPWWAALYPAPWLVTVALWTAVIAGTVGVGAGLLAVGRGARPPARMLVVAALAVTAVLAVLPPAGSTDTLDYAAYGRMVAIGHDPYVMTPQQLRLLGDPVGAAAPVPWEGMHSVYGPLATIEQGTAAILGGASAARITFWLKVWNALAFALVVLALDRLLRAGPAARARAHLLWSLNPLLLWGLVAAGHVDAVAAAVAFLALAMVSPRLLGREPGRGPGVRAGLAAGALAGMAADIKITFVLFGLGIAIAARRSWRTLAAAGAGALAVLVPSYLWFGPPALQVLFERDATATADNFYQLFTRPFGVTRLPDLLLVAVPLLVAAGWLLLRRLPDGLPAWPAVRPVLALSLAWLLVWPYQRPWYDAMVFCLLALFPASRLDWPVLARLAAGTLYSMPGMPGPLPGVFFGVLPAEQRWLVPAARLAALLAAMALCLTGAWHAGRRVGPPGPRTGWAARLLSARTPAGTAPVRAAYARSGAWPAPGNGAAGRPGTHQPGHG
jgi:alpha-1,6-mannosyltransferase